MTVNIKSFKQCGGVTIRTNEWINYRASATPNLQRIVRGTTSAVRGIIASANPVKLRT